MTMPPEEECADVSAETHRSRTRANTPLVTGLPAGLEFGLSSRATLSWCGRALPGERPGQARPTLRGGAHHRPQRTRGPHGGRRRPPTSTRDLSTRRTPAGSPATPTSRSSFRMHQGGSRGLALFAELYERRQRIVPARLLRALKLRDHPCRLAAPTNGVEAHHVEHWIDGGETRVRQPRAAVQRELRHSSDRRGGRRPRVRQPPRGGDRAGAAAAVPGHASGGSSGETRRAGPERDRPVRAARAAGERRVEHRPRLGPWDLDRSVRKPRRRHA